ncbi:MAG: hypothetical protein R2776_08120 [Flavobacteriaceae bacterium]
MKDVECWMLDVGCWMWDVGCGMWDVGCGMWDVGCGMLGQGKRKSCFWVLWDYHQSDMVVTSYLY